ncbi:myotubularin-related protein 10 isoform X2 [Malaya genurostris]|nr:myotubularin-related protein 10 isoform X2 [Malaya genurostris]
MVGPDIKNSSKIEILKVICKNFRTFTLGFKKAGIGKGKYIADALVKFAFPAKHNLLFLYNYKEKYINSKRSVCMFNKLSDWVNEVHRCGAETGWRVVSKDKMDIDSTLPMYFVVPKHMTDLEYFNISKSFRKCRSAIWVWSIGNAALVRMAELSPEIASFTIENTMLEHVRKCDPLKKAPHLMELSKLLPSIQEVNLSYLKLRKLCIPENDSEFMAQDSRFHLLLDKTYWLLYVSVCLKQSVAAAKMLMNGCSVVLQEINSRDMCCVLASLVQLLLDNSFRTIDGLQTLIQKEWISLGHPFSDRIGHVTDENSTERSPIFLLFLDCVWQLLQQFPEEFEFSETFLTSIWDCVFLPIFDTFQFNSETERHIAQLNDRIILRPAWDWEEQFSDKDIALFSNPLYKKTVNEESAQGHKLRLSPSVYRYPFMEESSNDFACASGTYTDTSDIQPQSMFLQPQFTLRDVEVWHQCYYRWIPFLEIKNGGHPQIDFFNRSVLDNIYKLEKIVQTGQIFESSEEIHLQSEVESKSENKTNIEMELNECTLPIINSFFPFTNHMTNMEELLDVLVINSEFLNDGSIVDCASINE